MTAKSLWFLISMVVFTPLAADADVCDDIAGMADGWAELADAVDETAEEGFSQADAEEADAAIGEALEATRELAAALAQGGEAELARRLHRALDGLEAAEGFDGIVDAMDGVVDVLDEIVDSCDAESPAPAADRPAGGAIRVSYRPAPGPEYQELAQALRQSGVFEDIAGTFGSVLALPADLEVVFDSCGEPNAFFDPKGRRIIMCYEFFALFAGVFASPDATDEEVGEAILGVGSFFLLHELGHALVHLYELPITGREEDAVDNLATLILLAGEDEHALLSVLVNFAAMADEFEGGEVELAFWDEHSLSSQRVYDVACLMYGSAPERFADLVGPDGLPKERAARCPAEYEQKSRAWDQLLEPLWADGGP